MPNTDVKLLRDELVKVIDMVRRHERAMREQRDHLVRLALERGRAVLEMEHIRAENEDLRARLAEYGQAIGPARGPGSLRHVRATGAVDSGTIHH